MDSQVNLDWYRANLIDNRWRQDSLPHGEAEVPPGDLPDPMDCADQGPSLTPKQMEQKWTDSGLARLLNLAQ
ncbi:unnamed protein product [Orchesella dallaii]|uniref:Anaphase-promoting complex subunit 13 n=1 Tax=Orchesella dallaii TaxID=48710 RepID=A0ABP1R9Q0_9HEXA